MTKRKVFIIFLKIRYLISDLIPIIEIKFNKDYGTMRLDLSFL